MKAKITETLEQWNVLKGALKEKGYALWQTQYSTDYPEGYHAWFMKDGNNIEVVTHSEEVQNDIIKSGL